MTPPSNQKFIENFFYGLGDYLTSKILHDALPSPLLDPLEGPSMLNCEILGLEGCSRLSALKGGRGAC